MAGTDRRWIMSDPGDPAIGDMLQPLFARRNVFPFALAVDDLGMVPLGVDLQFEVMRRFTRRRLGDDQHRFAGGEHPVHAGGADANPLLPAAHPQPMELRTVQQFAENQRDLFLHDARTVVLNGDLEAVRARGFDVNPNLRDDPRLLAGVERIVHGLLHGGEERFSRVVKTEQMAVLREELADGDVALLGRHRLRRGPAALVGRRRRSPSNGIR